MYPIWYTATLAVGPFVLWGVLALIIRLVARLLGRRIGYIMAAVIAAVLGLGGLVLAGLGFEARYEYFDVTVRCGPHLLDRPDAPVMVVTYNRHGRTALVSAGGQDYSGTAVPAAEDERLDLALVGADGAPVGLRIVGMWDYVDSTVPGFAGDGPCVQRP